MLRNFGRQLKTGRGCLGVGGGIMLTAVFHGTKLVMASITLTAALTMAGCWFSEESGYDEKPDLVFTIRH